MKSFYWNLTLLLNLSKPIHSVLQPHLEVTTQSLRSLALDYFQRASPNSSSFYSLSSPRDTYTCQVTTTGTLYYTIPKSVFVKERSPEKDKQQDRRADGQMDQQRWGWWTKLFRMTCQHRNRQGFSLSSRWGERAHHCPVSKASGQNSLLFFGGSPSIYDLPFDWLGSPNPQEAPSTRINIGLI